MLRSHFTFPLTSSCRHRARLFQGPRKSRVRTAINCRAAFCHPCGTGESAFTLIELLVVIAIISVLAAILFPVFVSVRAMARRTVCISNLRQQGLALQMYREDYGDFPPNLSAINSSYVRDPRIFLCPSDPKDGHFEGNERVEGDLYLPTGVSYGYLPVWDKAIELEWWNPPPLPGPGKWEDLTPIVDCNWHWATLFDPKLKQNLPGSRGWVLMLTAGASVRKVRVEEPVEAFTPDKYR